MLETKQRKDPVTPRGLSRFNAAQYVGVSTGLFDEMVSKGFMPHPRMMNTRKVWDVHEVDRAFDELPHANENNPPLPIGLIDDLI